MTCLAATCSRYSDANAEVSAGYRERDSLKSMLDGRLKSPTLTHGKLS